MLEIRPAIKDDARTLMLVHREAVFAKAPDFYDKARLEVWSPGATPERVAQIERDITDPNHIVLVAETDNQIIGFANASPSKNKLFQLYVKPNSIGNVGCTLLAEIEKQVFKAGAEYLEFDSSLNAEAFYKANGYWEVGRSDYVSNNGDRSAAVQMKKLMPTS